MPKKNKIGNSQTKKRKNVEANKSLKQNSQKRAKKAALSHMQNMDLKIKRKLDENWKKAVKDPLYKRALVKDNRVFDAELDGYKHLGRMDVKCERGCGAVHFPNETTRYICCDGKGHGSFEYLEELDPYWKQLIENEKFRTNIRHLNCIFQIATLQSSWNADKDHKVKDGLVVHAKFPYYIRVHGQLFHSLPPAIAKPNESPRFLQLYIIDNALEEIMKDKRNDILDRDMIKGILDYLKENNPWAIAIRRTVKQYMLGKPAVKNVAIEFVPAPGHRYRLPRQDIIAGFVPNMAEGKTDQYRSVIIHNNNNDGNSFSKINEQNAMYDPAHYVMMFPKGDLGYSKLVNEGKNDTVLKFYQQRM